MGQKINRIFLIFCILVNFSIAEARAQQQDNAIPLVRVLNQVQNAYDIEFNYALDNVENISIVSPEPGLSLSDTLDYLRTATGLLFESITNNEMASESPEVRPAGLMYRNPCAPRRKHQLLPRMPKTGRSTKQLAQGPD